MNENYDEFENDQELTEFILDPVDQLDVEEISFETVSLGPKTTARVPEKWTGVLSLDHDNLHRVKIREIALDLMLAPNLPKLSKVRNERNWAPLFFSKDFLINRGLILLEDFQMS